MPGRDIVMVYGERRRLKVVEIGRRVGYLMVSIADVAPIYNGTRHVPVFGIEHV